MNTLYQDSLIQVTDEEIIFHRYYFPFATDRHLAWKEIECVRTRPGGSWRLWGTGDFRTWFPQDNGRPKRDLTFIIHLRDRFCRIGFTVENSRKVLDILIERGLIREPAPA
jgi:hypothetical protein